MIYSFKPIYDKNSKILILGSMASVESLKQGFYYMHPRNRFWSTMAKITEKPVPESIDGKRAFLLENGIALMDSIFSCEREGSLDSDIKNVVPSDIPAVLAATNIKAVFCNGKKSYAVAKKAYPEIDFKCLPSTSPANAGGWKEEAWIKLREYLI